MGGLHKQKQCMLAVCEATHAKLKAVTRQRKMTMDQVIAMLLDRAEREN